MINAIEPRDADDDQIDRHHVVQQPRDQQDQNSGNEGDKRRDMRNRDGHRDLLGWQSTIMAGSARGSTTLPFYSGLSSAKADDAVIAHDHLLFMWTVDEPMIRTTSRA